MSKNELIKKVVELIEIPYNSSAAGKAAELQMGHNHFSLHCSDLEKKERQKSPFTFEFRNLPSRTLEDTTGLVDREPAKLQMENSVR
jgi:hypothetical protein